MPRRPKTNGTHPWTVNHGDAPQRRHRRRHRQGFLLVAVGPSAVGRRWRKYYSTSSTSSYVCTCRHVGNSQKWRDIYGAKNGEKWQMPPNVGLKFSTMSPTCHPTYQCRIKIANADIREIQLSLAPQKTIKKRQKPLDCTVISHFRGVIKNRQKPSKNLRVYSYSCFLRGI